VAVIASSFRDLAVVDKIKQGSVKKCEVAHNLKKSGGVNGTDDPLGSIIREVNLANAGPSD
jgi:hypothetical protein